MPGQIASLREVVSQVFLAGERFKIDPDYGNGFIGIRFLPNDEIPRPEGILVRDRIRGFPAYRYLQSGDVIVRLLDRPGIQLHTSNDFILAVRHFEPGDLLRLGILRYGRAMTVAIPLDFRPVETANETMVDAWIDAHEKRAEAYWNQEFSILEPGGVPNTSQASTPLEP